MKSSSIFAAAVLFGSAMAVVEKLGCYKSSTGTTFKGTFKFNSQGECEKNCPGSAAFATTNKDKCYCGDMIPADSDKVDIENCNFSCPGFPADNCKFS